MRKLVPAVFVLFAAIAGCGGGGDSDNDKSPSPKPESVIRGWTDSLRAGNVDKAASYFALPAIVENGTPPVKLTSKADVRGFNVALPCGAKLVKIATAGKFTTATFKLTGRPGPGGTNCGSGAGDAARTTFVILNGKIKEWRRVTTDPQPTGPVA